MLVHYRHFTEDFYEKKLILGRLICQKSVLLRNLFSIKGHPKLHYEIKIAHRRSVLSILYRGIYYVQGIKAKQMIQLLFFETWNPEIVYDTLITTFYFYKNLLLFSGFLRKIFILI